MGVYTTDAHKGLPYYIPMRAMHAFCGRVALFEHMTLTNVLTAHYTLITQSLCRISYLIIVDLLK